MRTWNRTAGLEPIHVFLEDKVLLTGFVPRPGLYENFLAEMNSETRSLEDLARLLNEAITVSAFQCIRMTEKDHNRISLIYELPSNIDHSRDPLNLATVLKSNIRASNIGSSRGGLTVSLPSITKRYQLPKTLISAMYQLHLASWMHREFSAKNVMFFWSQPKTSPSGSRLPYDMSMPYIDGFKNSRNAVHGLSPSATKRTHKLPDFLAEKVYRHPAYLLHKTKRWSRSSPHRSCHRFRHDHYALGLVLLEIGLWSPLSELEVDVFRDSSTSDRIGAFDHARPSEPIGGGDAASGTIQLSEDWLE
ncbi:hypothetical protein P171DRAFT_489037 [Karstenula rhodostoma CBS 690.94]|uniref:Protein kinase domain-containing protein n=1 Tax=Karstenula rhodostoma CBS 690.94 TaxID=1392251 RepID=A0A9P4U7X9_9PLEO|nr:hypothetical protein P171DRAFT_489037 [Karstenula rhodostoma CBS 690.94]